MKTYKFLRKNLNKKSLSKSQFEEYKIKFIEPPNEKIIINVFSLDKKSKT